MELRTTEGKINELLAAYEGIRGSSVLKAEHRALLTPTPVELVAAKKTAAATATIGDEASLVQSLYNTREMLRELSPKVEKFRKRLFEIDPVTEKPRYGPKSQTRVRILVNGNDFLCSRYDADFPEQYRQQKLQLDRYRREQLDLQEQRQEQRRQEHLKREELRKEEELRKQQEEEGDNKEEPTESTLETTPPLTIDANMNPDGSIIIQKTNGEGENNDLELLQNYTVASPSSILFAELQKQYEQKKDEEQRLKAAEEEARIKEKEDNLRRQAEEEDRQKAAEAERAAARAAEEEARREELHRQAEEARLRRRAQEEARKQAEREWLDGIQKGAEGVKHYLKILLLRGSAQAPEGEKDTDIDPDRIVALESLCTLFEQINKHPEETNKRKIKLSNPNFHRDIGRHEGGIELLVAAGFRPTMMPVNDSPSEINANVESTSGSQNNESNNNNDDEGDPPEIAFLISKEPNLEHDMDGWMAWFDLNKATLEILQNQLSKVRGSKRSRR